MSDKLSLYYFLMLLMLLSVSAANNLAYRKPATQSSDYNFTYTADKAVNGNYTDTTATLPSGVKWWSVDLLAVYQVAEVRLVNRYDCCRSWLAKISLLTSIKQQPGEPSLSSDLWITRNYQSASYGAVGVITFRPPIIVQHLAVFSANNQSLSLAEFEVFRAENLAFKKSAQQNGYESIRYPPSKAVNGLHFPEDFTHTFSSVWVAIKWWMVDLGAVYSATEVKLFNRISCCSYRLAKISTLTTVVRDPGYPSLTSNGWERVSYREEPYGAVGVLGLQEATLLRHLAVLSENIEQALSLREVEVYVSYNLASYKPTYQSSTAGGYKYNATNAVNGVYDDFSQTKSSGVKWWRVELQGLYNISTVKLCNRVDCCDGAVANVSLLTSAVKIASPPSLTSNAWVVRVRSTQQAPYSRVKIFDFDPAVLARHVALFEENNTNLSLVELEVYGIENLALHKPARQSSSQLPFLAYQGVNGNYDDFTHTHPSEHGVDKWWTVDLQAKYSVRRIELINRPGAEWRLAKVTILTSSASFPEDPSLTSDDWTSKHYQEEPYGAVGVLEFASPTEMQHLAVYSEIRGAPLSLAEVVIYEFNYALLKNATQSTVYSNSGQQYIANRSVDGNMRTLSLTEVSHYQHVQWWTVDLAQRILLRKIKVYVRNDSCDLKDCSERLSDVYFLTHKDLTTKIPYGGYEGWQVCSHSKSALGNSFTRRCFMNSTPVTRMAAIRTDNGISIELREVEVYGHELPQLQDIDRRIQLLTYDRLTISIPQWNQTMPGSLPPRQYRIDLDDGQSKIFNHNTNSPSGRITADWTGLQPGRRYTFSAICTIQTVSCPGVASSFSAATLPCSAPDAPEITGVESVLVENSSRKRWRYTLTWQVPEANCYGALMYTFDVNRMTNQKTSEPNATFYLDGDARYNVTLKAINTLGLESTETEKSGVTDKLVPQLTNADVTLLAVDSGCVRLSWREPRYVGGPILEYMYFCSGKRWTVVEAEIRAVDVCGYEPSSNIVCSLMAVNEVGNSTEEVRQATTTAAEPLLAPGLTLTFNTSCAFLHIHPMEIANQKVTHYQYSCRKVGSDVIAEVFSVSANLLSGFQPSVCQFSQVSQVSCFVRAFDVYGESPEVQVNGFTDFKAAQGGTISLLPPVNESTPWVLVKIQPALPVDTQLRIKSYSVLMSMGGVACSMTESSDYCYITAEVDSVEVNEAGYTLHIGDGMLYGAHINRRLLPGEIYTSVVVVRVQVGEENKTSQHLLKSSLTFTAPGRCSSPPDIKNARVSDLGARELGVTVLYACEDGYMQEGQLSHSTCHLSSGYLSQWSDLKERCRKGMTSQSVIGIGIGAGILVTALVVLAAILFCKLRFVSPAKCETEAATEMRGLPSIPSTAEANEYGVVGDTCGDKGCEYESVPEGSKVESHIYNPLADETE